MSEEDCTTHPVTDLEPTSLDSEEYDEFLALSDNELGTTQADGPWCFSDSDKSRSFQCIHKPPAKFKSPHRQIFIEGIEIELEITSFERSVTTHVLNPNLYTISLKHGEFQWTIRKRYKDILNLHQQLRLFRTSLNIPLPSKTHREQRHSFKNELNKENKGDKGCKDKKKSSRRLPRFPSRPEVLISYEQIETRARQLEDYLRNLLSIRLYREHYETAEFFEVSEFSFIGGLGSKGMEGMVKKRTRSVYPGSTGCNFFGCYDSGCCVKCHFLCSDVCASWRTRWLIVKDNFVAYVKPKDGRVKAVLLFDAAFDVSSGVFSTGYRKGLQIMNLSRQIIISCPTKRTAREWQTFIKETVRKEGGDFTQRNRYFSFCPVRSLVRASWLVDGRAYMSAVATALDQAKQEIFIADWWLSPEIYMKRPGQADYWRLDVILKRKAAAGVKVFVLLYKEVELAIGINSFYSKQTLINESENIKVLRHPDHAKAGVFLWAHHEKMVVIDQSIAFVGGIDLCYGRWDDHCHRLTDLGPGRGFGELSTMSLAPIAMAANALNLSVLALSTKNENGKVSHNAESEENGDLVLQPSPENIKCNTPEMEKKSIFDSVKSKGRDFIHMLSFIGDDGNTTNQENAEKESPDCSIDPPPAEDDSLIEIAQDPSLGAHLEQSTKLWIGKDYTNFIVKDFDRLDLPFQDLVDRTKTPRMPWHDVGVMIQGSVARDLARHFIQRWNAVKLEKSKLNPQYPYLLPKSYQEYSQFEIPTIRSHDVSCQVVRSISHWSGGFIDQDTWEASIHEAIVDAIAKARYYIYIENQFFISCGSSQVKNQVSDALFKRILRAHREKTVFRVFVILPLLPGFEGEVGTSRGTALHAITHWNYASICRGKDALITRLKSAGVQDPEEYITFNGLRNHSSLNGKPVTELIYVHSKLLIADDRLMICGSANINDRSLLGKRDSEIGVVIEDETYADGVMNGAKFLSGRMCGSLRRYLFREHLGLLDSSNPTVNVKDPISSEFYHDVWRATATRNTAIYDKVFQCLPRDDIKTFKDITRSSQASLNVMDPVSAFKELDGVQGHLVMFPLDFLKDEVLTPNSSSVEGMMPTSLWT